MVVHSKPRPLAYTLAASLVAGLVSVGTFGCSQVDPETYQVRLISIDAHGGPALPEDRVQAIVRRALAQSPSFTAAERDLRSGTKRATLAATLEYRELPDASDQGRDLLVRLSVEAPRQLAGRLGREGLDVTVLLERDAGEVSDDLSADLGIATEHLATILQARTDLARETQGSVARLLKARDPDTLILTLEWVRDHQDHPQARDAADRVAELIEHEDDRVALLAIQAIGQIGGPEHVTILLDRIQLADTSQAKSAYDALAKLGGPEAEGFLEFAVRNEDEPRRRAAAERALYRVAEPDIVGSSASVHPGQVDRPRYRSGSGSAAGGPDAAPLPGSSAGNSSGTKQEGALGGPANGQSSPTSRRRANGQPSRGHR